MRLHVELRIKVIRHLSLLDLIALLFASVKPNSAENSWKLCSLYFLKSYIFKLFWIFLSFKTKLWVSILKRFKWFLNRSVSFIHFVVMRPTLIWSSCLNKLREWLKNLPLPSCFLLTKLILKFINKCKIFCTLFLVPVPTFSMLFNWRLAMEPLITGLKITEKIMLLSCTWVGMIAEH